MRQGNDGIQVPKSKCVSPSCVRKRKNDRSAVTIDWELVGLLQSVYWTMKFETSQAFSFFNANGLSPKHRRRNRWTNLLYPRTVTAASPRSFSK